MIFATYEEDLHTAFNLMNSTFKEYSLKINADKNKSLACYKKNIQSINITLDSKLIIVQVDYFNYLGSVITNDGKSTKEIRNIIGQAKNASLNNKKLLTSKNMRVAIKKRFIKQVLYGSDTWTMNKKEINILEELE